MIALIIYLIGIFITPVIFKKYTTLNEIGDKYDLTMILLLGSTCWPIVIIGFITFKIADLLFFIFEHTKK